MTANRFRAKVVIRSGEFSADGRSILEVMTLAAPKGTILNFEAEGDDAQELVNALIEVVNRGFDEK